MFFFFSVDFEIRDNNGHVALWLAILSSGKEIAEEATGKSGYSSRLVEQGSSPDAINHLTGTFYYTFFIMVVKGFRFKYDNRWII